MSHKNIVILRQKFVFFLDKVIHHVILKTVTKYDAKRRLGGSANESNWYRP